MPNAVALPPGPRRPQLWQLSRYVLDPIAYAQACAARHGPLFTLRMPIFGTLLMRVVLETTLRAVTLSPARGPEETPRLSGIALPHAARA